MTIRRFNTLAAANSCSNRTIKASIVLLGDDNLFWVCSLKDAKILINKGYEVAK